MIVLSANPILEQGEIKIHLPLWHHKMHRFWYHTPCHQEQILRHPISVAKAAVLYNQE